MVMGQAWPWEHTAWMKPHAAGYYATVLGEDLDKAQVLARCEELLVRGQPTLPLPAGYCPEHRRPCVWGCELECFMADSEWRDRE